MSYASMEKLHTLRNKIEQRMQQSYLDKNTEAPFLDENKLLALQTLFGQTNLPDKQQTDYMITIMLVQLALDTHDKVIKQTKADEMAEERENRQLTVLAGNYYSALYYQILAGLDDIDMVALLASGIKQINEQKMSLYYDTATLEAFFTKLGRLEGCLFRTAASRFTDPAILEVLDDYFLISRLHQEIQQDKQTSLLVRLAEILDRQNSKRTVLEAVYQEMDAAKDRLKAKLNGLPPAYAELSRSLLVQEIHQKELYLEEG
ncbi:heptaprenyl diphosphate synthase component 1 [Terribacillus saccharophilus]|uniref:heptaprenyl diphosphate synthase component 1 n=1 Tax=Terribacillus saccharophilus TaxID=361277 RepID=UPI0039828A63